MVTMVSAPVMSASTMIPTMAIVMIVARVPITVPAVAIIAMAVVAGTEAEINRRFDHHGRLVITIIDWGGITRSRHIHRCWPADDHPRQGR